MPAPARAAVLGASGWTGADLLRIGIGHPGIEFAALAAESGAGKAVGSVLPHLAGVRLPDLVTADRIDWRSIDVVFSALPHGRSQAIIKQLLAIAPRVRVIDLAADYRLRDLPTYQKWYTAPHVAPELQKLAAYGLTEHNRDAIRSAPIIACPGCYPTAVLLALLPLVKIGAILTDDLIIDAKSGVTGAGRGPRVSPHFAEFGESVAPYAIGGHRHAPEIEQELSKGAGKPVTVNFTPHLLPMSRGELITAHVRLGNAENARELTDLLRSAYAGEPFIRFVAPGESPATGHVRGSNLALMGAYDDRIPHRAIVVAALDNLVKGGAGQAIQNFNVAFGWPETTALEALPLFP